MLFSLIFFFYYFCIKIIKFIKYILKKISLSINFYISHPKSINLKVNKLSIQSIGIFKNFLLRIDVPQRASLKRKIHTMKS